jgi:hypothetical protein
LECGRQFRFRPESICFSTEGDKKAKVEGKNIKTGIFFAPPFLPLPFSVALVAVGRAGASRGFALENKLSVA